MRRRSYRVSLTGLACAALAAIVIAGCGSSSSSSPGVTSTSITFGTHQPLTGPAAPGYSEIAPASQAFFNYLNAGGGINGRKINLIYKDDEYNPAKTVNVVHELVLQDNVFGIFEGLGTPTHTKVVGFLNSSKVPDLFVASGCPCWDNGSSQPYTFGWQPNYTIEGKILGQYIKQHFAGKKVGVFYQDDDFGNGGLTGIKYELPASQIVVGAAVSARRHERRPADLGDQGGWRRSARRLQRADLHRARSAGVVHARLQTAAGGVKRRHRPDDRRRPAENVLQGQGRHGTDRRRDHRRLPPVGRRNIQPVGRAVQKSPRKVRLKRAVRRQRGVRHGKRLHARPGAPARGQEPDARKRGRNREQQRRPADRPGPRAVPLLQDPARRLRRRGDGPGPQRLRSSCSAVRWSPNRQRARRSPPTPANRRLRRPAACRCPSTARRRAPEPATS